MPEIGFRTKVQCRRRVQSTALVGLPTQLASGDANVPDSLHSPHSRRVRRWCLPQGHRDCRRPAGLTNTLTSKLGISESQASAALGSVLNVAKVKLSPEDYSKLAGAIPGASDYLTAAAAAGVVPSAEVAVTPRGRRRGQHRSYGRHRGQHRSIPGVSADSATTGAAAAVEGATAAPSAGMGALTSTFSKLGIPPEAASQFVPVLTDYVGKVGGPETANLLKGLF